MNYPLISEYIEAIKSAEDNFNELSNLKPILGDDGLPLMTSGNFAVVFKMKDEQSGKCYAVKCFTKEQEGREKAYHQIADALKDVDSLYLVSFRYLEKELFVDTDQIEETEFPVLLMDWVEGKTLDKYLRENLDDKYALEMLAYRFCQLAQWLIPQDFAHGDLKPDNILVREDGTLVLVDYDGMYVPAMKGQQARELGSPDFRHPQRTENDFDEHIDDFPLICMSLSLKAISIKTNLFDEVSNDNGLLFATNDFLDIANSKIIRQICNLSGDTDYYRLLGGFFICIANKSFSDISHKLFGIQEPKHINSVYGYYTDPRDGYTYKTIKIGNQIWLAEDLRYLPRIGDGYYVLDYDGNNVGEAKETQNYKDHGVLYNMIAAQEACPVGWHIPRDAEWKELECYLGLSDFSKEKCVVDDGVKRYFRGHCGWGSNTFLYICDCAMQVIFAPESGLGYSPCAVSRYFRLRCIKDDSPFSEMPNKEMPFIPYLESVESVKSKIKELFLQVAKAPYYPYLAIIHHIICKDSAVGGIIRSLWIPSEINSNMQVTIVVKRPYVECTYSKYGIVHLFSSECNIRNIDDVVELSYELINRLGLVGDFISNGSKVINFINKHNILNDRKVDLPF